MEDLANLSEEEHHEYYHQPMDASSSSEESSSEESGSPNHRQRRSTSQLLVPPSLERTSTDSIREKQLEELIAQQPDKHVTYNQGRSTRTKRSFNFAVTQPIGKAVATWRLMSAHTIPTIPVSKQNAILTQAFRYWSEVAPICFREEKHSARVDIEVGFVEGITIMLHNYLSCYLLCDTGNGLHRNLFNIVLFREIVGHIDNIKCKLFDNLEFQ